MKYITSKGTTVEFKKPPVLVKRSVSFRLLDPLVGKIEEDAEQTIKIDMRGRGHNLYLRGLLPWQDGKPPEGLSEAPEGLMGAPEAISELPQSITHRYEPMFGTHIREAVSIIRNWFRWSTEKFTGQNRL